MVRLLAVLCIGFCCISYTLANCRGNREDREHECHNDGEVCVDGKCRDPCGSGWRIVVNDPSEVCRDHEQCIVKHCQPHCANKESSACRECHDKIECRESFCCKPNGYNGK